MTSLPPVPVLPAATLERLATALTRARYTPAALRGLWGTDADAALDANDPAPARRHCLRLLGATAAAEGETAAEAAPEAEAVPARDRALAAIALLFLLDTPVGVDDAAAALGADLVETLRTEGLLVRGSEESPGPIRSVLDLTAHPLPLGVPRGLAPGDDTLLLFADHGTLTRPDALDGDYVLGYGGAGRTLLDLTPRGPVSLAADIGTGCGIQTVLLARHADRVIATDLSQRALAIARLTVGLAGAADRVEFRHGSLFEPLPEAVDLLVSNPPFVITPRSNVSQATSESSSYGYRSYGYRDGGLTGDAIMRAMVSGSPEHLRDDGTAVMLGNWEHGADREPPTAWVGGDGDARGTSATVIERQRMRPAAYARTWIRDGGVARATARWHADVDRWLTDLEARGVEEVGFGWVVLHRAASADDAVRDFAQIESGPGSNPAGLAAFLSTRIGLLEWLYEADDAELIGTAYQLAPDVTEHRHLRPGADDPTVITIEQGGGLAQTFQADPALAGFLGVCDGTLTMGQISAALAQLLSVDEAALTAQLLDQVRTLVPAGVIVPVTD
ncbi:MAG: methyltransferase [Brevibacterium yomogidense]